MTSLIRRDAVNTRPGKNPLSLRAILEHASVGKPKHHIGEVSLPDRELYTVHEFKSINGWVSRRFYYKNGVKCDLFGRTVNDPGFNSNSHTAQTYPEPHPIVPTGHPPLLCSPTKKKLLELSCPEVLGYAPP